MTGNATMTRRATGCPRKKTIFGHFLLLYGSKWTETMLYDQGISLRRSGYPTCLYSEKIAPRPPVGGRSAAGQAVFRPPGQILARKSVFCYRTPDFVNGPFVALAKAVDLAPSDRFFDFSFLSYGCFREGDPPTQQKVLPHLTVRALTDSNSPSALRAWAGLADEQMS